MRSLSRPPRHSRLALFISLVPLAYKSLSLSLNFLAFLRRVIPRRAAGFVRPSARGLRKRETAVILIIWLPVVFRITREAPKSLPLRAESQGRSRPLFFFFSFFFLHFTPDLPSEMCFSPAKRYLFQQITARQSRSSNFHLTSLAGRFAFFFLIRTMRGVGDVILSDCETVARLVESRMNFYARRIVGSLF